MLYRKAMSSKFMLRGFNMAHQFKAGDSVQWRCYGQIKRGTIVEAPNGNVAIIRCHETWRRTWARIDSLQLVAAFQS